MNLNVGKELAALRRMTVGERARGGRGRFRQDRCYSGRRIWGMIHI